MANVARLETLTRIGFAARGLLYLLIGYAALKSGQAKGRSEVISDIDAHGPGQLLLILMGLGFLGYGLWRLIEAATDSEGNGDDAKGWAIRTGGLVSGLIHIGLCASALGLALGKGGGSQSDGTATQAAGWAMDLPGGTWLLTAAAAIMVGAGLAQLIEAVRLNFLKFIDPEACRRPWVRWSGRIGYAARGVAFAIIGWLLWRAAMDHDASQVGDVGAAIAAVPAALKGVLAAGLGLFGLFSLVQARYRRINDQDALARLSSIR